MVVLTLPQNDQNVYVYSLFVVEVRGINRILKDDIINSNKLIINRKNSHIPK